MSLQVFGWRSRWVFLPDWTACRHICHFAENPMPDSLRPPLHVCVYIRDTTPLCRKTPCLVARIVCVKTCVHYLLCSSEFSFCSSSLNCQERSTSLYLPALKQSKQLLHSSLREWGEDILVQHSVKLFINQHKFLFPRLPWSGHKGCVWEGDIVIMCRYLRVTNTPVVT